MKWKDNLITDSTLFKDLGICEGFEKDKILYIKMSNNCAFDVINNREEFFNATTEVTPRNCEIIFHGGNFLDMKWTGKSRSNKGYMIFKVLAYGNSFERGNILYIKIGANNAFDVIHKTIEVFHDDISVLPRDCEVVFY